MLLLVLGGTVFLSRAVVAEAVALGHDVAILTRGSRPAPAGVEALVGDRDGDLSALTGRSFDAVLDVSVRTAEQVAAVLEAIPEPSWYGLVSSISAYATPLVTGQDESAPLVAADPVPYDPGTAYGAGKAGAERELAARVAAWLVVRPGLIVGPGDESGRFTWWVDRLERGGATVAPEPRQASVQVIDVRDLARWLVTAAERRLEGTFNAVGPELTMEPLLLETARATGSAADLRWIPEQVLMAHGVGAWTELPLWLNPAASPEFAALMQVDGSRARAAGLRSRPLGETVADTLAWRRSEPAPLPDGVGLTAGREAEILAWQAPA